MARSVRSAQKNVVELVTVKGIRHGLLFVLSDQADFADVIEELGHKIPTSLSNLEAKVTVYFDTGEREVDDDAKQAICALFEGHKNLTIGGFEGSPSPLVVKAKEPYVYKGTVRSGMVIEHDGDVVILGDVNPGAQVIASGDIYVMGHLRGSTHAGATGNHKAVIAACYFSPIQIRIAHVLSRGPDVKASAAEMEFAYLNGEQMAIEQLAYLGQHRAHVASFVRV